MRRKGSSCLMRRKAGLFCAGGGLCSAPSAASPLCFTFSTVIHARVVEKGTVYQERHPISLYLTALEMALEILLNICITTFECRRHKDQPGVLPQRQLVPVHSCAGGFLLGTAQIHGLVLSYHRVWGLFQNQCWKGKGGTLRRRKKVEKRELGTVGW